MSCQTPDKFANDPNVGESRVRTEGLKHRAVVAAAVVPCPSPDSYDTSMADTISPAARLSMAERGVEVSTGLAVRHSVVWLSSSAAAAGVGAQARLATTGLAQTFSDQLIGTRPNPLPSPHPGPLNECPRPAHEPAGQFTPSIASEACGASQPATRRVVGYLCPFSHTS